jgi:hypothetical protein
MVHPGKEKGYPLDFHTVVRQVATKLERARPEAVSVEQLIIGMEVPLHDLNRVKVNHRIESDREAVRYLVERAIEAIQAQPQNGGFVLSAPLAELTYDGSPIHPSDENPYERLGNAYDPMRRDAAFKQNIRAGSLQSQLGDLEPLCWSMREWGWIDELGRAIVDERGVVIVGHRRLAVADELGITETTAGRPIRQQVEFGRGDDADIRRTQMAIASNWDQKKLTPADRRKIAFKLYHDHEWSQQAIAQALQVSQAQVSYDLSELSGTYNSDAPRKRGGKRKPNPKEPEIKADLLVGLTEAQITQKHGVTRHAVRNVQADLDKEAAAAAKATEQARSEPSASTKAAPPPEPTPEAHEHIWQCRVCGAPFRA